MVRFRLRMLVVGIGLIWRTLVSFPRRTTVVRFRWRMLVVGNNMQVNNSSGWFNMENISKLPTENGRRDLHNRKRHALDMDGEKLCGLQMKNFNIGQCYTYRTAMFGSNKQNLWALRDKRHFWASGRENQSNWF